MSTSLLCHGFGIRGYRQIRASFEKGAIHFLVEDRKLLSCAACQSKNVIRRGAIHRSFKTLPIGRKQCFIQIAIPRLQCLACGTTRQAHIRFAQPRVSYTRAFKRYVLELSCHMTISAIATLLGVSWDVVKSIQKTALKKALEKPRLKELRNLAIDEIYCGKKQKYLTLVLDLDTGAIVFVGEGKGSAALEPFWKRMRVYKKNIKAVAVDMANAYFTAVHENLPKATLVFDHFHIVKLMNDKLTKIRRAVQREATDKMKQAVLKGTRWLLLKNPENLCSKKGERKKLEEALRLNEPLYIAYYLKEDLRQLWSQDSKKKAESVFNDWVKRAESSGVKELKVMAKTLQRHRRGILAYYDHPISTGKLEGINRKIRVLQRQAYRYRDIEFFKLRLKALHLKMSDLFPAPSAH